MALDKFGHIFLPYCVRRNDDRSWSILNREYQDLGLVERVPGRDENGTFYPLKGLGPVKLATILRTYDHEPDIWWLYGDHNDPSGSVYDWRRYCDRLRLLTRFELSRPKLAKRRLTSDRYPVEPTHSSDWGGPIPVRR